MKRKPDLVKAAALAAVAKKTGGVFVFATRDANLPNVENVSAEIAQYPFAEVQCASCGSEFHSVAAPGMQPHCVTCGHGECKTVKASTEPTIAADENLTFLTCAGCGTHNVFHSQVASIGKSVHCTLCGTGMKTQASPAVANGDMMDALDTAPVVQDVDDMELLDLDDELEESNAETTQGPVGAPAEAPMSTPDPVPAPDDETTQGPVGGPAGAPLPADPVVAPTDVTTQGPVGAPASELSDADEMPNNDYSGEDLSLDMLDTIDEDAALAFVYTGTKVSLVSDDKIIATLEQSKAGENASIMQTATFVDAVSHTIKTQGLKKALAQYKFVPTTVKFPLSKAVAKKVESAVKVETASLGKKASTYSDDFQQSLDIAVAGFAQNFWRGRQDPLKVALATELSNLGIKNPTKMLDRVMSSYGVAQLREIVALARELATKPIEARNGLAEAINLSKYQPMAVKAEAEDDAEDEGEDEDDGEEEADVQAIATPVESVTASTGQRNSVYKTPEMQSILGSASLFGNT